MGGHLNLACRSFPVYHLVIVIVRYGVQKALFPIGNGGLYGIVEDDDFSLVLSFHHIQGAELACLVVIRLNNGNHGIPVLHHRIHIDDADSCLSACIQGRLYLFPVHGI